MSKVGNNPTSSLLPATDNYSYYKFIKTPTELGMNDKGTNIAKNFGGLIDYMNLLISGNSRASKTGRPLGNKFFTSTLSKCTDETTGSSVPRYLYFDYIPTGKINIPMDLSGVSTTSINTGFNGMVPGLIEDLGDINPLKLLAGIREDTYPKCINVTLDTINQDNQLGAETHHVTVTDLLDIDPCNFSTNVNPATKSKCKKPHKHVAPSNPTKSKTAESFDIHSSNIDPYTTLLIICVLLLCMFGLLWIKYQRYV